MSSVKYASAKARARKAPVSNAIDQREDPGSGATRRFGNNVIQESRENSSGMTKEKLAHQVMNLKILLNEKDTELKTVRATAASNLAEKVATYKRKVQELETKLEFYRTREEADGATKSNILKVKSGKQKEKDGAHSSDASRGITSKSASLLLSLIHI